MKDSKPNRSAFSQAAPALHSLASLAVIVCAFLLAGMAQAQPTLQLRFPFDDSSGTNTPSDTSSGGVAVTLQMMTSTGTSTNLHGAANSGVAGLSNPNRCLNLSSNKTQGSTGNFAAVTNNNLGFGNVTNFVVTMWMKTMPFTGNTLGRMFLLGNSTNSDVATANSIGMKWQDTNHLYFYVNTTLATATFASAIPTNTWLFVAMVYDGTNVTLYEGTDQTPSALISTTAAAGLVVPLNPSVASLFIGNRPARDRDFIGFVDDFRFYTGLGATAAFVESVRLAASGPDNLVGLPGNNQVSLTWTAASGAASYNVKSATTSGGPYTTISTAGTVTTPAYTDLTAVNGTTYYYVVSAVNGSGVESANSPLEAVVTPSPPPLAPASLTLTPGNAQIGLTWSASTGAATYNVKRSTNAGGEVTITNTSATSLTDIGLINGFTYYYEVSALSASGSEGSNSTEMSASPFGPPPAPTALTAYGAAIGQVGLTWSPSFLATSYNVYRATTSNGAYTAISTPGAVTGTSFTDTTVPGSGLYYYEVSASNAQGEGPQSLYASAAPLMPRLRFDFSDTGTTTTDLVESVVLNIVNSNNVPTDYHGVVNSGVAGAGKALDFSANPYSSPPSGPLASTLMNPALNFGAISNFTLTFWVKPDSNLYNTPTVAGTNNPRLCILSPSNVVTYPSTPTAAYPGVLMKINSYDTMAETGEFKVAFNGTEYTTPSGSLVSAPGLWSFIAVTYDGLTIKIYSATQTNSVNTASGLVLSAANPGQVMYFTNAGNLMLLNETNLAKSLDGLMADFRFYSGAGDSNFVENVRSLAANPPAAFTATAGSNQVGLSWSAYSAATSYNIKRANSSGGPYTTISSSGTVTGTSFTDATAADNTTYYYVVSAVTAYGESANSTEASATAFCTPPPTAGNNGPVCSGSTLSLTASTVAGATYSWTGPNGFVSTDQNPSIPNADTNAIGIYDVTVTVDGCTSAPASTVVIVNPTPAAPTAGNNGPILAGATLQITASTVAGATYSWTGPNGFTSSLQNPSIPNATTAASGEYDVTVTVGGCSSPIGPTVATVNSANVTLSVQPTSDGFTIDWPNGTLQSTTNLTGPWQDVTGATAPFAVTNSLPMQFFRVKVQ
jgi:fibronectin type 3 domain-containing protein